MLASDSERDAAVLRLRAAHLEGRISDEELEERIGRAHGARTREELDAVALDLPPRPVEAAPTSGVPRLPGRRHFHERRIVPGAPGEVRERIRLELLPGLERLGFYLHRETGDTLRLENRRQTGSRASIQLLDAGGGRTLVLVHGNAPLRARRAFASL